MLEVIVQNELQLSAPSDEQLLFWASNTLKHEAIERAEICIRIVSKEESRSLNDNYRNKNNATNVLSFPSDIPEEFGLGIIGDLAICSEIVIEEAANHGIKTEARWSHMVAHGVLHLLGYDHIEAPQALVMETLETKLLTDWGYNDPYHPIDQTD